jgi:hypothetical protein
MMVTIIFGVTAQKSRSHLSVFVLFPANNWKAISPQPLNTKCALTLASE